ncbi:MAG: PKD domain-containing protein [Thermoplasmata archaeon]|nr:PKD domain-containing protein [Thermoplasmata archaeon]MBE3139554.1 PKD domain-containing protein [Thermoplasmata archaeon]
MKNKIVGIFVCMLMIVPTLSFVCSTYKTDNGVQANDLTEQKNCGCESQQILTDQKSCGNQISIDDTASQSTKPTIKKDLPPYFSWKDYNGQDWTTPAKDQGNCGSCWDFAAIGALESIIQIREGCAALGLDLSEQYVLSCLHAAGSCKGGWAYSAYRWIKSNSSSGNYCNGIIPEFCFPYQVNDDVPCANASPDWNNFLIPISTYGRWVPDGSVEDRNAMKTQIMEFGPIVSSMLWTYYPHGSNNLQEWGWEHHNPNDYYSYPGPVQNINHQVVIVGWKDDLSIPNGGYWIVKNSFSEEWGYDGYFNIEYGSLNIDNTDINWVEYNQENYSNWVPVAQTNGPYQEAVNQEIIFNGSTSLDHEGTIESYVWDLGDGTTKTGVTITHSYVNQGIYPVTLTVTDNENNTCNQTTWAYIDKENHPPQKPTLRGRRLGSANTSYEYTFYAIDSDGDDVYYYLNWGDTYWDGGSAGWIGPYPSGQKITLEKTWKEIGNYTVRIKARDQYNLKSNWSTLKVTMPVSYNIPLLPFWEQLFERFPHAFPILRQLLGY